MTRATPAGRMFLTGFDATPPWEREDGHGPVSDWTRRAKTPGERVLCEDRLSGVRHYDFADAVRLAKRNGWRAPGDPGLGTLGEVAARAAAHDFAALRAWCADEWRYCGVVLSVSRDGVTLDDHAASLWGVEANYPGSDNAYLTQIAEELAEEARGAGRAAAPEAQPRSQAEGLRPWPVRRGEPCPDGPRRHAARRTCGEGTGRPALDGPARPHCSRPHDLTGSIIPSRKNAPMRLQHIPLADLKVSTLNMRHGRKKPDLTDLLPSVRARGVLVPLIVRPNGSATTFEIVGGRRRYFAAKQVAKEAEADEAKTPLPCHVLDDGDDASAVEASLLENTARLDPDPMQQFEAFKRLMDESRSAPDIATLFGLSELVVNRRLALARLIAPVRAGVAAGKLDLASAQTLTLATEEKQRDWFELYACDERDAPFHRELRAYVLGGSEIETSAALFDLEGYDGGIVTDLFGERSVFADATAFWQAQDAAIKAVVEGYTERGWAKVMVLRDAWFREWDHERAKKADNGQVFVEVRRDGTVDCYEGWLPRGRGTSAADTPKPKREMSGPMEDYVTLHRHAAVRAGVATRPEDALRLVIAHIAAGSQLWTVLPEPQATKKTDTRESVAQSLSQRVFEAAWAEVAPSIGKEPNDPLVRSNGDDYAVCAAFETLREVDLPQLLQLLAVLMAESLEARTCTVEHLASAWQLDFQAAWRPDDAFFALLRDKAALSAMLAEAATPAVAKANAGGTAKQLRTVLR